MAIKYLGEVGIKRLIGLFKKDLDGKQDVISGKSGQLVGFDANGNAVATSLPNDILTLTDAEYKELEEMLK